MEMIAYRHSCWRLFTLSSSKHLTNFEKPALIVRVFCALKLDSNNAFLYYWVQKNKDQILNYDLKCCNTVEKVLETKNPQQKLRVLYTPLRYFRYRILNSLNYFYCSKKHTSINSKSFLCLQLSFSDKNFFK